ncbi:hypothetical protein N7448_004173 [Penicillium atrosanguineum]|uniref:Something about silencing protein 4 domain-containing protein n=1 Tax=Penicillium atrosanguineum TaxID=1132637 RepID=A0A9W9H8T0_9EURO|nr:hypothetical protein N7448_004173 [Penicillium atrosanguineum]KAJ5316200.1 hypothetical protein N7476_006507 [Penicillium atrosanguineum]
MALLPRPSLRGSVRRTPDEPFDDHLAPPAKKQRTLWETGLRRRKSSPDCLDTTPNEALTADARLANPPLKTARPKTANRHTRRVSASSIDTVASNTQLNALGNSHGNGNGAFKGPRAPDRDDPSGKASADLLHGARESPDPLDTISPAASRDTVKSRLRAFSGAAEAENKPNNSPSATRTTRQTEHAAEVADTVKVEQQDAADVIPADVTTQPNFNSDTVESDQPDHAPTADGRRSLRSADTGSRCKSELAQYFYNYEQIISLEAPKTEVLGATTTITLINNLSETLPVASTPNPTPFGNPLEKLYNCEVIELPSSSKSTGEDPLSEELYFRAHRKFERQEKQLRNIERDRAQHKEQQIEQLLEDLRGHDWLRVMGLPGVHDSEKKLYEPKREILIQEMVALVNKFQAWRDEERRRKLAKEKPLPHDEADRRSRKRSRPAEDNNADTRQLHQEARSASDAKHRKPLLEIRKPKRPEADETPSNEKGNTKRPKPQPSAPPIPAPYYYTVPDKPFTSFFEDRHARDVAVAASTGNRRGRTNNVLAFGQPIPEVETAEFEPDPELLTEEAIQASRRQRRLLKRRSAA